MPDRQVTINFMLVNFTILMISFLSCNNTATMTTLQEPSKPSSFLPVTQKTDEPSPIRSVDFANFTYPAYPAYLHKKGTKDKIKLDGGTHVYARDEYDNKVGLAQVEYGDVTQEGEDEAFVILTFGNRGTARLYSVYIYTLKNSTPDLLWSFETGDRIDDGLKKIYAEQGNLVVENIAQMTIMGRVALPTISRIVINGTMEKESF